MNEETGSARLNQHFDEFSDLVRRAQHELGRGRSSAAATWAQIAANFGWLNHPSVFASPELEDLLATIAGQLEVRHQGHPYRRQGPPHEVLHVATQAYSVGGHTQMLARWISQDDQRHHRVLLTRQGSTPLPTKLSEKLRVPDELASLDQGRGGLLQRAARLRAAARSADVVLLHVHPYDVVPSLAFSGQRDLPPVVMVNHSDHAFWIGTRASDVVLNLRDSGRDLAVERRGVEVARATVMARPLGVLTERQISREQAKLTFGVDADQVLIVTAAAGSKYEPLAAPSLIDLIMPVFLDNPNAILLAAGPDPTGQWADAQRLTDGRIRALGRLPDVSVLHQAADGYLDSFPFASLTSMIESGSFGNPLLTYRGHPDECAVLGADTRGLDEYLLRPQNPADLINALSRMISDRDFREKLGEQTRIAIESTHVGVGWRSGVETLYALANELVGSPSPGPAARATGPLDQLVDRVQSQTGHSAGRTGAVTDNLGLLPTGQRISGWRHLRGTGGRPSAKLLVPEWLLARLSRVRGRLSR